jgi:hypothetical protein
MILAPSAPAPIAAPIGTHLDSAHRVRARGRWASVWVAAWLSAAALPAHADPPRLLSAAAPRSGHDSPRRLFNLGLRAEEEGDRRKACRLYLAVRLALRASYADELYARGAALRLVRLLVGEDEDAALAAAVLADGDAIGDASDLFPIVRGLMRRFGRDAELVQGLIVSVRYQKTSGEVLIELENDAAERRIVAADGPIAPFSAGQRVRALLVRAEGRASAAFDLVAIGADASDAWSLLRVRD